MTVIRNRNGSYAISDIVNGYLFTKQYYGYTKREAIKLFRQEVRRAK